MNQLPTLLAEDYPYILTKVLESIDDSVLLFDNFKIIYSNAAASTVFGYTKDHLVGRTVSDLIPKEHVSTFKKTITSLSASPRHSLELKGRSEFIGKRSDGHIFYAEGKLATLKQPSAQLLVLQDITWKKILESELELTLAHVRTIGHKIGHKMGSPSILEKFPVD